MRTSALLLLVACACATPTAAPPTAPVSDLPSSAVLFERHLRAVGGDRAVTSKRRVKIRFTVSFPDRGVEGRGWYAIAEGRGQLEMDLEGVGRVEKTFERDQDGWATDLHFDARLADHYTEAKTLGRTTIDGLPAFEVTATGRNGPVTLFFDASAGVLIEKKAEIETPDGRLAASTRFKDYQDFGGVRCARIITQRTGDRIQQIQIDAVEME